MCPPLCVIWGWSWNRDVLPLVPDHVRVEHFCSKSFFPLHDLWISWGRQLETANPAPHTCTHEFLVGG